MRTNKIVLGTLAGLAIGAVSGVLFAPERGLTTRKKILGKGNEYKDEIDSKFNQYTDPVAQKLDSTKKNAEGLVNKGLAKYDNVKKDVKNVAENFKNEGTTDFNIFNR